MSSVLSSQIYTCAFCTIYGTWQVKLLRQVADALAMPKSGYKVHPLLAAIGAGRTGKQAVCVRESNVQQGDQVILQHGLYFRILLVLPVAGL